MSTRSYVTAGSVALAILFSQSPQELTAASNQASLVIRYEIKHDKDGQKKKNKNDVSPTSGLLKPSRFTVDDTGALQAQVNLAADPDGKREVTLQSGESGKSVGTIQTTKSSSGDSLAISLPPEASHDPVTVMVNTK